MALADLADWMNEHARPNIVWYVKRLAANDTLASGSHQAGPYMAKEFLFDIFPSLNRPDTENPDKWFNLNVDSHSDARQVRAVWYNNRLRGGTRNETRLTNFGGENSPLLDAESTGALAVFAFHRDPNGEASVCHVWVCDFEVEAEMIEDYIGPVEPGKLKIWAIDHRELDLGTPTSQSNTRCWLKPHQIPLTWLGHFPTGAEIIHKTVEMRPEAGIPVDTRLLKRRECEYEIFRSLEQAIELPALQTGFNTIEEFITRAQTVLQRRKVRSGRSLELHTREIFIEEKLREGLDFSHQPESDLEKHPDFLFPSETAYKNASFPVQRLRMLAVKTTCKDRWRQILNEADRIKQKHLLTLQEGVSESQFREMTEADIKLVIPQPLIQAYPPSVQQHLQTLESFIGDIRLLSV